MKKCKECGREMEDINPFVKIKLSTGIIEVEKKLHTEMDRKDKIIIPKGYRLLTLSEFLEICNEHRSDLNYSSNYPDEVVKQPIKDNEKNYPYWNAWFCRLDNGSGLNGSNGSLDDYNRVRGVRFVKDVKK